MFQINLMRDTVGPVILVIMFVLLTILGYMAPLRR